MANTYEPHVGESLRHAMNACQTRLSEGPVTMQFNGITVVVTEESTYEQIEADYTMARAEKVFPPAAKS